MSQSYYEKHSKIESIFSGSHNCLVIWSNLSSFFLQIFQNNFTFGLRWKPERISKSNNDNENLGSYAEVRTPAGSEMPPVAMGGNSLYFCVSDLFHCVAVTKSTFPSFRTFFFLIVIWSFKNVALSSFPGLFSSFMLTYTCKQNKCPRNTFSPKWGDRVFPALCNQSKKWYLVRRRYFCPTKMVVFF